MNRRLQDQFLIACDQMAVPLRAEGFEAMFNGQMWQKTSDNKDTIYEVHLQPRENEETNQLEVIPHVFVLSIEVQNWLDRLDEEHSSFDSKGIVWGTQLGFLSSYDTYHAWSLSDEKSDASCEEIAQLIREKVLPIFHLFDDTEKAVDQLAKHGGVISDQLDSSISSLAYMLVFGSFEQTEQYFNHTVEQCSQRDNILSLYHSLPKCETIDLDHSEFNGANNVKLAFLQGVKLWS